MPAALTPSFLVATAPGDGPAALEDLGGKRRAVLVLRGEEVGHVLVARDVVYATIVRPTSEDLDGLTVDVTYDFSHLSFAGFPRVRRDRETVAIVAWTPGGELLWRFPVERPLPRRVDALAALPGCLLGAGAGGAGFCLEERR